MNLTKQNFILKCLRKISHKEWELFVITRIIHGLDDDEIEFVTQQLIRKPDGQRYLTDLYFPQLGFHIEIDEKDHDKKVKEDERREQDIVQMTGHKIERIKISDGNEHQRDISQIRADVDRLISKIRDMKCVAMHENRFDPWDFESRYLADPVIKRGHVSIKDNVVFKTQAEALRCFGYNKGLYQRGAWVIPDGTNDVVWFPRLYKQGWWVNELAEEGKTIRERAITEDGRVSIKKQMSEAAKYPGRKHIVFAKYRDVLGFNLLRYVGSFQINFGRSTGDCLVFDRIADQECIRPLNV